MSPANSPPLPDKLEDAHQLIGELLVQLRQQQVRIDWLARKLFGRSSERMAAGELEFFGQAWAGGQDSNEKDSPTPSPDPTPQSSTPPKRKGGGRRPLPPELPRQRLEHDVAPEDKTCAQCGSEKKRIGEETSEQLEYIPASYFVIEHVCPKYACARCQDGVVQGQKPAQPIEKAIAGPGLLANVITSKYCDHLPLYRQEGILARHGLDFSRSTLCDWAMKSAEVGEPVVRGMIRRVAEVGGDQHRRHGIAGSTGRQDPSSLCLGVCGRPPAPLHGL